MKGLHERRAAPLFLFAALLLGAFRPAPVRAAMDDSIDEGEAPTAPRRAYLFADLDYFDPTQLANQLLDATGRSLAVAGAAGINSVSASGAWGARLGVLVPLHPLIAVGGSFGYIAGPRLSESAQGTINSGATPFTFSDNLSMNYWRFLAEARERLPISGPWALGLGEGLGVAIYSHVATCSATGLGCSTPLTTGTGVGFSWEVEPSLLYGRFGIAFRYAQFPGGLSNGGQFTREWGSLGSFLEVVF